MSFFDFNIYTIPEAHHLEIVSVQMPLTIIVREHQLGDAEKELLVKILASVGQSLEAAQVVKLSPDTSCRLQMHVSSTPVEDIRPLIIVFGLLPEECSMQVEKRPYTLLQLKSKSVLFAHSLNELSSLNDAKRALWIALKKHFKKD